MIERCYNNPAYVEVTICKRWYNFQWFCEDVSRLRNHNDLNFEMDKDLRILGSRQYNKNTVSFVPKKVNNLIKHRLPRKYDLPEGIDPHHTGGYAVRRTVNGVACRKVFKSLEKAKHFALKLKKLEVNRVADLYRNDLHPLVYKNLKNYDGHNYTN